MADKPVALLTQAVILGQRAGQRRLARKGDAQTNLGMAFESLEGCRDFVCGGGDEVIDPGGVVTDMTKAKRQQRTMSHQIFQNTGMVFEKTATLRHGCPVARPICERPLPDSPRLDGSGQSVNRLSGERRVKIRAAKQAIKVNRGHASSPVRGARRVSVSARKVISICSRARSSGSWIDRRWRGVSTVSCPGWLSMRMLARLAPGR